MIVLINEYYLVKYIILGLIIIFWLLNKYTLIFIKNRKNKLTICFRIVSSDINVTTLLKNNLFNKLTKDFKNQDINVTICDYKHSNLLSKNKKLKNVEILKKLNVNMIFELEEKSGRSNSDINYAIRIKNVIVGMKYEPNKIVDSNLKTDIQNSLNYYFQISEKNDFNEIETQGLLIEISINYILSIVYLLHNNPYKSLDMIKTIEEKLAIVNIENKKIDYIMNSILLRKIDAYSSITIVNNNDFNIEKLSVINSNLIIYKDLISHGINKYDYDLLEPLVCDMYVKKSVNDFDLYGIDESMEDITRCEKETKYGNKDIVQLNKAYLLAMKNEYGHSISIYNSILNKKYVEADVEQIKNFISTHIKLNKNKLSNLFCETIYEYYKGDMNKAYDNLEEIKNNDEAIYKILLNRLHINKGELIRRK